MARTGSGARKPRPLRRRRIIERPRLLEQLDESTSRVRTLVAPAGYGKTTLAEQWVGKNSRRGVWYTARSASTDVAALALGVAKACTELIPGCDARLRAHLRAVPNPGEHVDVLAEILGEELAEWGADDWLVLDDYHELAASADAERFVEELLAASPVQLLIASRQRPAWVTGRSILYGDVLELNQTVLAMDNREAAELLEDRSAASASGLVALANGWPAVIALASVSSAEIERDDEVPESLYQFFAEEVFHALGDDVRTGLTTLSQLPIVERELAVRLLSEASDAVLGAALDVGILVERESSLEMHPLARAFLEEWRERSAQHTRAEVVETALGYYTARRDWDASFELLARNNCTEGLERLTRLSLDELLETARLSTIDAWCDYASEHDAHDGIYSVARAEVALRYGRLTEAQAFAEVAALADTDLVFRGLSLAGRAAHLATREDDALDLFRRAERAAERETDRRDALWGQFLCALELELPDAALTLQSLKAGVAMTDARDVVRAAACDLGFRLKFGELDLTEAERALQLMHAVADPLVTTSFQNVYGHALALSARYREALQVVDELLYSARKYRLAFVTPYGLASAALSKAGLRQWEQAREHLDEADAAARATRNGHAEQLCCACRLRLLAQEGKHSVALSIELPGVQTALPAIRAELLSSQALVLVVADRVDEASRIIDRVRGTTSAIEPTVLISAVDAIAALKLGDPSAPTIVERLEREVFGTGATDLLVTAYRASPELLATLLRVSVDRDRLWRVIRRIGDDDLTRALGIPIVLSHDDRRELLTRREREVYELLCQGLTNRQIASSLFISEATVKLHAHHIYDKLGTRSRRALAIQAALERSDQATSATRGSDTPAGEDSS